MRAAVVLFLVGLYGVPLFFPPGPAQLIPPPPDASLLERLFPGVPGWWVVGRLLCLLLAGLIAATMVRTAVFVGDRRGGTRGWWVPPAYLIAAAAIAALHLLAGFWAAEFSRPLQLLYIAAFAIPAMLLWAGEQVTSGSESAREPSPSWRSALAIAAVLLVWAAWRIPMTWRSLRGIDFIDVAHPFTRLVDVVSQSLNLVSDNTRQSSIHLVFQGAGLLGGDVLLNWGWLQLVSIFWILVSAVGVAYLATRLIGRHAAPVATAAFLFSPFVLSIPMSIVPLFLGPIFTVALLALMLVVDRERRPSAVAALGAVAGLGALIPPITPLALVVGVLAASSLLMKRPRVSPGLLAIAVLSGLAAVLPALPSLLNFQGMALEFSSGRVLWSGLEAELFGQILSGTEFTLHAGHPGAFDTPLSAFLSPFALSRTAIRLWGDAVFDPIGAGLVAVGLVACLPRLRKDRVAAVLWVLFVVALLTLAPSSYDRPSFARMVTAPVVVALWTAAGFEVVRRGFAGRRSGAVGAALATVAIALGGGVLFDYVNPRILARSAIGLALTALEATPASQAVIFANQIWDPQWSATFTKLVPAEPRQVLPYGSKTLEGFDGAATPAVMLWSPGLEEAEKISAAVCGRWPAASLYTLYDQAHLSRVFAASRQAANWQPALPPSQWTVGGCEAPLETEGSRAAAALASAEAVLVEGRNAEAIAILRPIARQSFIQVRLFETLAHSIVNHAAPADLDEAIYWARRASESKLSNPRGFAILAVAYGAQSRYDEAVAAAQRGEELAQDRDNEDDAREMRDFREFFERKRTEAQR